jgi:hypothetical protein
VDDRTPHNADWGADFWKTAFQALSLPEDQRDRQQQCERGRNTPPRDLAVVVAGIGVLVGREDQRTLPMRKAAFTLRNDVAMERIGRAERPLVLNKGC